MPGVGKSNFSKRLSEIIEWKCKSIDEIIVSRTGMSIEKLFRTHGEKHFRRIESETLAELANYDEPLIIDCGGGIILSPKNRALIKEKTLCITLHDRLDKIYNRIHSDELERPLFKNLDYYSFQRKMRKRESLYEIARIRINESYVENSHHFIKNYLSFLTNPYKSVELAIWRE